MSISLRRGPSLKASMTLKKGQEPLKSVFPDSLKLSNERFKNYSKGIIYQNTCTQSWYKPPSCLPALRIPVQFTSLKPAFCGNITCTQHTHSYMPATAPLLPKYTHVVNKAYSSSHSQNNTGLAISGKKYTDILPKILPYLFTVPWRYVLNIVTK